jgi:hypothetical protein
MVSIEVIMPTVASEYKWHVLIFHKTEIYTNNKIKLKEYYST